MHSLTAFYIFWFWTGNKENKNFKLFALQDSSVFHYHTVKKNDETVL